ncbi:iron ABC transporter permease [Pseudooceanicola sp. CBS1P-1]|uniref:Iron chelate uptake ABC transporter family permease subunit n=1 Tax=Pseudooceanicola albus TaxID=2692189 RepID=A0A6L7FWW1_9RHOB|nr:MULTISPECIES: iron ABC transporter permease [Pseudooceanicola]MBT9383433.1 iron ABC transporter permease [Pseudooceanicola endophyticus]MXN16245.1 iron chelate uptake ABC transporter family permease subunit [Pseudooceanicola albus]
MTRGLIPLLLLATLLLALLSLSTGPVALSPLQGLKALLLGGDGPLPVILRAIRLPRTLLAVMIGGSLGLSGAALQGYLRNPLAEPGVIGISGAAALGAVLAIQTGLAALFALALPLAALGGALIAVLVLLGMSGRRAGSLTLILSGIAISALTGAATSLVLNLSPNPFATSEIVFWMMGSLADRSMSHVWLAAPFMALGLILFLPVGRGLEALTLGEDAAASLGIALPALRLRIVLGTACMVGAGTAVAGSIGFVGLVVPHLLRPLVGARPGRLLWASMLGGAVMVLAADVAVRLILPDRDLKLGVLTALIGAPFFLHLVWATRRERA